jgi:hypothetical protein
MFKLEAVKCKKCGSGLLVELNDKITYCTSCGSGFEFINDDMVDIEINFAAASFRDEGELIYKPFWFIKTHIDILERTNTGGFISKMFGKDQDASFDLIFYIPAFQCPLESLKYLAQSFTAKNPVASPQKFNTKLTGFVYGKEDAKKLCEFILISFEAEKSDTMKTFSYRIDFKSFEILGVPFYKKANNVLKDGVLGIEYQDKQ